MNFQLIEKLRKLVQDSSILNESEKKEWLSLLELMNDKQLLELERILVGHTLQVAANTVGAPKIQTSTVSESLPKLAPSKPIAPAPKLSMPAAILAAKEATAKTPKVSLGHIINLPKLGKELKPINKEAKATENLKTVKDGGFLARLKARIKEPELPPGHILPELEITAKSSYVESKKDEIKEILTLKPTSHILDNKPKEAPALIKPPLLAVPKPTVKPLEVKAVEPAVLDKSHGLHQRGIKDWPSHYEVGHKPSVLKQPTLSPNTKGPLPIAGVKLAPLSEKPNTEASGKAVVVQASEIKKPEDLENMGVGILDTDVGSRIKEMIRHLGFFEVMSHVEKSPLYLNYVATGKLVLEKNVSFENLTKENPNLLNHSQFEKTADLLRTIQAE